VNQADDCSLELGTVIGFNGDWGEALPKDSGTNVGRDEH